MQLLKANDFKSLTLQTGKGTYKPSNLLNENNFGLSIEHHQFIVLEPIINDSDLVISHCGAGVLLECLRAEAGTTNIAVVNSSLMDNHQQELADKLHSEGHNLSSTPAKIMDDVEQILGNKMLGKFKPYPPVKTG